MAINPLLSSMKNKKAPNLMFSPSLTTILGGDDEKNKKPQTYQSQKQINAQIAFDEDFNKRHNLLPGVGLSTNKKIGDPVVQFRTLDGKPYVPQQMPTSMIKKSVPDWVTELKVDDNWKQPYYLDGNDMVYVDRSFLNSPRFLKTQPVNNAIASK